MTQEQAIRELAHIDRQRTLRIEQLLSLPPTADSLTLWLCDQLDALHVQSIAILRQFPQAVEV